MSSADLKRQVAECQAKLKSVTALERLLSNNDFNLVIAKDLFEDKANSLVLSLNKLDRGSAVYDQTIRELDAISSLRNYLVDLGASGAEIRDTLKDAQTALDQYEEF